ncbi:hypothetical protein [Mycobacteroides abscessus]|uniref:hypothetical protein n=1 Tax=Mycobacteroides abscessus TaxID=36809 RepID=UPI0009287F28|nr:hypothetical protein [Mycobacteroides abscessus]SHW96573.1 Uncharacterised protein [Mycobacteroides abscessus subsp. abscessus]SIA77108.1 Uncharacterised protein [Mycobacteroides abscessus subsp. abscessus]SKR82432.1 Uncharacterised protein [Mycobacteroides abscessus subsp. abscessus]
MGTSFQPAHAGQANSDVTYSCSRPIFETESAAAGWMADHGYKTLDESRSELLASFEAQYAKDLQQYQKDLSEVEKMRAAGVAARLHPKLSHPREPAISEFWVPSIYHEIVPASVVG